MIRKLLVLFCILLFCDGSCFGKSESLKSFLDAKTIIDGWEESYCHIDSLKVSCTRILVDEKGQDPTIMKNHQIVRSMYHERIQDGTKFLSRATDTPQGFTNGADYLINSFDGSIGREYRYEKRIHSSKGYIYRGLRNRITEKMNLLGEFLQTNPSKSDKPASEKDPPWKVKLRQQYPLGIPAFLYKYNIALKFGEVKVRPHLEYVAGEACHVLEFERRNYIETFWLAHEKGMLPMKKMYASGPVGELSVPRKVVTEEVKEITSVVTETGILWYPREIMKERTKGPDYSYTLKTTVNEFVPYFKAPPETFSYVFPSGTRVWDKIQNLKYIVESSGPLVSNSLIGKSMPDFNDVGIKLQADQIKDKNVLVCFWDINQRASRNYIPQLSKRAQELRAKDITIVTVQAANVEKTKLNEWIKENNFSFPVGTIEGDSEKTRFEWGVKSLPWLILTDKKHVVVAEGFNIDELDEKIASSKEK